MKYFTILQQNLPAKNDLDFEINFLLYNNSRLLLKEKELEGFKNNILQEIKKINAAFPKCMPKKAQWDKSGITNNDFRLIGLEAVFYIYSIKSSLTENYDL
ncbi:hypothetical protein HZP42_10120 [Elizabethkingia anophelis]|nr:hypothetical protein [Elizabethkingia anophelis]